MIVALALPSTIAFSLVAHASTHSQWALEYLHAEDVWHVTRGTNEVVAVVDTGVQPNPDISPNLLPGADFSDLSSSKSTGDGWIDSDNFGHGTGEAVLIAGSGHLGDNSGTSGLAPEAKILPLRSSSGSSAEFIFGIAPAIDYAIAHHATVINMALMDNSDDRDIHNAISRALEHGVIVVAAVGNDGTSQQYFPAAWPGVVGVGAIDRSGKVWERSNTGPDVDLVAPGVHILRDDNRGRVGYSDGTSEATAYVSAAAALVRSAHPEWSAEQVVEALTATADKPAEMRGAVRDDRYGSGILNVLAAVSLKQPPDAGAGLPRSGKEHGADGALWWWVAGGAALAAVIAVAALVARRPAGLD